MLRDLNGEGEQAIGRILFLEEKRYNGLFYDQARAVIRMEFR